ncbi:DUF1109 domain-containing protein [Pyxidicoccus xibeiensis]|uniref:DUF1109 domain-containing protein n=1 Tax=Pyxidicoccus xibeiensis TaxID=2906759 RepID=UPI0020A79315|nr:DUF1109 domain-containing protein [Pyxidicoccus xibeiensis]MCP3137937.1 DUF1109 domain-containing protein [Pyxidicoccus xibeiensis]
MSRPPDLDSLLSEQPPPDGGAAARVLAAARGELALRRPVRPWRTQALWLIAASGGMVLLIAAVMLATGAVTGTALLGRAHLLALLLGTGAVCAWGALSPRGRWLQRGGVALSMLTATVLVLARGTPQSTPTLPGWVCTAGHVAVALVPLVVALVALRSAVFEPLRSLAAGLAVGTTGALLGELACEQDWRHVAGYHLFAWGTVVIVSVVISRSLKPRSYAP